MNNLRMIDGQLRRLRAEQQGAPGIVAMSGAQEEYGRQV